MYSRRISTGIPGLDAMLRGGLIPGRTYLVKGAPGTGKTTLAFHFLMEGVANGENVLYITLEEPVETLVRDMMKIGFDVRNPRLTIIDATPATERYVLVDDYFDSIGKSLEKLSEIVKSSFAEKRYSRIVVDPITMIKLATRDEIEYRKEFLKFIKSMMFLKTTVLLTSEIERTDIEEYLVNGVIELKACENKGKLERTIRIRKFRGSGFDSHARPYELTDNGMVVYPDRPPSGL